MGIASDARWNLRGLGWSEQRIDDFLGENNLNSTPTVATLPPIDTSTPITLTDTDDYDIRSDYRDLGWSEDKISKHLVETFGIKTPAEREFSIHAASPVDVTRPMTTVNPNTDEPKGPLDFLTPEGLMSLGLNVGLGFTKAGTPLTIFETVRGLTGEGDDNWLSDGIKYFSGQPNTRLGGLIGEPTGSGLFSDGLDEGSYTDMGDYSYGTIDDIGVEEPY